MSKRLWRLYFFYSVKVGGWHKKAAVEWGIKVLCLVWADRYWGGTLGQHLNGCKQSGNCRRLLTSTAACVFEERGGGWRYYYYFMEMKEVETFSFHHFHKIWIEHHFIYPKLLQCNQLSFSKNILLRRLKFQILLWCLKAKFQIPLSAKGYSDFWVVISGGEWCYGSNSTAVVVLIINILLRRVEFGIWLSNTTEKFEISLGFASWNFKFFCGVWKPNSKFHCPQKDVYY